jgi:hypothetical protein
MQIYLVQTKSGLIQEELINEKDAHDVAQWMVNEYETDVDIIKDDITIKTYYF